MGGSSAADREVDEQLQDIYAAGEWVGSQPGLRAARSQADKMCELTSDAETGSHGVSGSPHITCCGMVERRCLLDCLQALKAGGEAERGWKQKIEWSQRFGRTHFIPPRLLMFWFCRWLLGQGMQL